MEPLLPPGEPVTPRERRILAAAHAGELMEGGELTADDVAAGLRLLRGQSTVEQERDRVLAEISARRKD